MSDIERGCWVDTQDVGEAVVIDLPPGGDFAAVRYRGTRADGSPLWPMRWLRRNSLLFLRGPDEESRHVLTLTGPYGEGFTPFAEWARTLLTEEQAHDLDASFPDGILDGALQRWIAEALWLERGRADAEIEFQKRDALLARAALKAAREDLAKLHETISGPARSSSDE